MRRFFPILLLLCASCAYCQLPATLTPGEKVFGGATAAVIECIMLDLSNYNTANNIPVTSVFAHLTKAQRKHLLDTILSQLSKRYSLNSIAILQKDSIAYTNSSMKGIGKLRKNDWRLIGDKKYDYYIKIYSDYVLSTGRVLGLGAPNTAQPRLSLYIAVFDSTGQRIWYPDATVKGGIGLGMKDDVREYYDSNMEKAEAYLVLFGRACEKVFK